jgi:Mrp family chromosome partitioning ATPase
VSETFGRPPTTKGAFASLERSLEGTIASLARASGTAESRALLIEARRLRSIVVNWYSIPPSAHVHAEMLERVVHLSTAAGTAPPQREVYPEIEAHEADKVEAEELRYEASREEGNSYSWSEPETTRAPGRTETVRMPVVRPMSQGYTSKAPPTEPIVIEGEPIEPRVVQRAESHRGGPNVIVVDAEIVTDLGEAPADDAPTRARPSPFRRTETRVTQCPPAASIDGRLTLLADPYSERADAYRGLMRKLTQSGVRVLAVTSAEHGEGKTSCAANLALAMRESARGRVLLIEADARAPALARLFDFAPPACLHEQLEGRSESAPWDVVEQLPSLHVLAFDPAHVHGAVPDPAPFARGIASLKLAEYELIVIDTPPVLGGGSVNVVADQADGVVLVAMSRRTQRKQLKRAHEQLTPTPVLGVVVLDA